MTKREINKINREIEMKRVHISALESRIRYYEHVEEDYNKDRARQIINLTKALERTKEQKKELEKLLKNA